jgi:Family of unknown function (DUF6600)/FecR protein
MKKTTLLIAALAFLSLLAFAQDEEYYSGSFVRMTYVKGDVIVQKPGDLGTEAGVANVAIVEGDRVETRNGRTEISFGRKNYLRLDNNTLVEFSNLPRRDDDRIRLHLLSGNIYLRINQLQQEKTFEVHTPDASFYVLEEGLFRFDARDGGETELTVLEGSVEAAGEGGSQLVGGRERLLAANGQLGSRSNASYGRDDFDSWNGERDALQSRYVSKQYLPSELDDYESELADNGYWTYQNPYGYVWVPYVRSYADWRPYYYGYWDWYPLCGWTWIPYETWGWPVYHYGRWGWGINLGWYWIPHRAWGPAWVHWYWGYDYCGWSPLSWYNYPCVLVDHHFYDRYHGGHYPCGSHAMTVVHKNQLQNRHISQVALSRVEAGRLGSVPMQAKQPDIRPTVRSSELQKVSPGKTQLGQPQIRPSSIGKSQLAPAAESTSRLKSSSSGQGGVVSKESLSKQGSKVSTGSLSGGRSVQSYPSSGTAKKTTEGISRLRPESAAPSSSTARQIRPSESSSKSMESFAAPTIRSYSSSPRVSSDSVPRTSSSKSAQRVYAPSSNITRYGTSYGLSSSRTQESRPSSYGESRSISRSPSSSYSVRSYGSSPSISRPSSSSSSGSRYYSGSSSRSVFSAPSSYSAPRSYGYSSPSFSRSSPNNSMGSRSYSGSSSRSVFSAPRSYSSSSSHSFSSPSRSSSSPSFSSGSRSGPSHSSSPSRSGLSGSIHRKN